MASFNQALMFFSSGSTLNGSYLALAAATSAKSKTAVEFFFFLHVLNRFSPSGSPARSAVNTPSFRDAKGTLTAALPRLTEGFFPSVDRSRRAFVRLSGLPRHQSETRDLNMTHDCEPLSELDW